MARKNRKSKSLTVNFSGVETMKRMEEGEQLLKVVEVTQEEGEKASYLKWKMKNEEGAVAYNNTSLAENSLWNLKAWLEALGVEVPEDEMDLDLEDYVDRELTAQIEHEIYQGKKQARIVDFWAAEEESKGSKKGKKKEEENEDEDGEIPDEDEIRDMSRKKLVKLIEEQELEIDADDFKKDNKLADAIIEALEEKASSSKKKDKGAKKKKGKEKPSEDEIDEMTEKELGEVIEEHGLDVDLEKYRTLRKMQAAVKEALED